MLMKIDGTYPRSKKSGPNDIMYLNMMDLAPRTTPVVIICVKVIDIFFRGHGTFWDVP